MRGLLPNREVCPGELLRHMDGGLGVEGEGPAPQHRLTASQRHEDYHLVLNSTTNLSHSFRTTSAKDPTEFGLGNFSFRIDLCQSHAVFQIRIPKFLSLQDPSINKQRY
jgi:hypothetical protein